MAAKPQPMTTEDWFLLEFEVQRLFDGAPVDDEQMFAGRSSEITKMLRTVLERARHVVLFGERGVGKTSLSNIFWKRYGKTLQSFIVARVQCGPHDDFSSIWIRALEELQATGVAKGKPDYVPFETAYESITPTQIRRELQKINPNALPVIILDEYDKIIDAGARVLTANLIKELYDFAVQKSNLHETLLACALAKCDDEGFFKASDLVEPLSAIMRNNRRIAHFDKHLRRFSGEDGGHILVRRGGERQQIFRFADPMMQPYVLIRGIQSGMIDENAKTLLLQKAQKELPI